MVRRSRARAPQPRLRPFVSSLWCVEEGAAGTGPATREHVLPTGSMHLVFRLGGTAMRRFAGPADLVGHVVADAVVCGAHAAFYTREVRAPLVSVGAQLRAGASQALFGPPAIELAGRHTALSDLWGPAAARLREGLARAPGPDERLDLLEAALAGRLPGASGLHPAIAQALAQLAARPSVGEAVRRSGYSHRQFVSLFRSWVGLPPKLFCRIRRFQTGLERAGTAVSWSDVAAGAGYSDQAHLTREFRELAGVTPSQYRRVSPVASHHLPVPRPAP